MTREEANDSQLTPKNERKLDQWGWTVVEMEFGRADGMDDLVRAEGLVSAMGQQDQGKAALRQCGIETGRIQAGLPGMIRVRPSSVLAG